MEVKIGVTHVARELTIDTELSASEVEEAVRQAIAGEDSLILSDSKGRRVIVPITQLAYVDITAAPAGQVGFLA